MSILFYEANWLVSFLPKSDRLATNTLASCTTSLFYVNLFQRTLSLLLPQTYSSLALASDIVRSWKRMQRYSFLAYKPNLFAKSCLKTYLFNTCLQLIRVILLIYLINIRMRARGCVRAHTHRLHVWQVTRCMEHGSCLFEHGFLFFWTLTLSFRILILFFWTRI